ncbi:MAG: hypothetical protein GY757_33150 [bacterium]|nr:hypothetical protein [bacterium]
MPNKKKMFKHRVSHSRLERDEKLLLHTFRHSRLSKNTSLLPQKNNRTRKTLYLA